MDGDATGWHIALLGPITAVRARRQVAVGGPRPQGVLALLVLAGESGQSTDQLVDGVWGLRPPESAVRTVRSYVSRLRALLGPEFLALDRGRYRLSGVTTDVSQFEELSAAGRRALAVDPLRAEQLLTEAIALWRGTEPAEGATLAGAAAEATRLRELRHAAEEDRLEALLATGRAAEAVADAERLYDAHPLRERLASQLMRALYRSGRAADALAAYRRTTQLLADELGIEPGAELRRLQLEILRREPRRRPRILPTAWTSFVGRQSDRAAVTALTGDSRLVTLLGPGGVGKTRLAVVTAEALASAYPGGTVFVDLVPARDGHVAEAVAATLGVTQRPQQTLVEAVAHELSGLRTLLVLDNCEHLVEAAGRFIGRLLADCPTVTVLATSRHRLGLAGEQVYVVPPLGLDAATLFLDRARAAGAEVGAASGLVADICERLDGMPLAIELAAARTASLGLDGLRTGLDDQLRLLTGSHGSDDRHRSLRAVVDWSYDLLEADERRLLRAVAIFTAYVDLAALRVVTPYPDPAQLTDLVGRLVDRSLLVHRPTPTGSAWGLLETVRAYAHEQLIDSGDERATRQRYLTWAESTAASLEQRLADNDPTWLASFDALADDLRNAAALTGDLAGYGLVRALGHLSYARRFLSQAREHYVAAAARVPGTSLAAADLANAAAVAAADWRSDLGFDLLLESAAMAEEADDRAAQAIALASAAVVGTRFVGAMAASGPVIPPGVLLAEATRIAPLDSPLVAAHLAVAEVCLSHDAAPPTAALDAALAAAQLACDPPLISGALDELCRAAAIDGRLRDGHRLSRQRLTLIPQLPRDDPRSGAELTDIVKMAIEWAVAVGNPAEAMTLVRRMQTDDLLDCQLHMYPSQQILPLTLLGDLDGALQQADLMWDAWSRAGEPPAFWMTPAVAATALACGLRHDRDGYGIWRRRTMHVHGTADFAELRRLSRFVAFVDARVALHEGRIEDAADALGDLVNHPRPWHSTRHSSYDAYAYSTAAEVAVIAKHPRAPDVLAAAAPAAEHSPWAAATLARATARRDNDASALQTSITQWHTIHAAFEEAETVALSPSV